MLIRPHGKEAWQRGQDRVTPGRHEKRKFTAEVGYRPAKIEHIQDGDIPPFDGYVLPRTFCVDCGDTQVTEQLGPDGKPRICPGAWELDIDRPDLRLRRGDKVFFFICHICGHSELWGRTYLSSAAKSYDMWDANRQKRRMNRVAEWIKSRLSTGDDAMRLRR